MSGAELMPHRSVLQKVRRVVVKIGSRVIAEDAGVQKALVAEIAQLTRAQRMLVVVSSGAIALGCQRLGYRAKPKEISKLQAAAAAGQSILMRRYDESFAEHGLVAAQVLLTHADLADRERLNNARQALAAMLEAGAVPVVNENDTVATEEIRFGDNDQLAAMVTPLAGAELLVLLTDVEGVLNEEGKRIGVLTERTRIKELRATGNKVGAGGISSKMDAAWKACRAGAVAVIAPASRPGVLHSILSGADVGTFFPSPGAALRARKHWIAFTLRPKGTVVLDQGAVRAIRGGRSSLLPVGVLGVRGQFNVGDSVRLVGPDGAEIARGLTRLGTLDLARAAGQKREVLAEIFGAAAEDTVVVHKDDLVLEL
jgi:glutamate 5-kinase